MGLYALYGGVVVAVAGVVLGVVGEGSGGLAGGEGYEKEEDEDGSDRKQEAGGDACAPGHTMVRPGDRTTLKAGGQVAVFTEAEVAITQSRYKQVRFHFVRWLVVG